MLRFLPALAVLLVAVVVTWNIARRTAPLPAPPVAPTATPAAATPPTGADHVSADQTPTPVSTYRLAGTVVGDMRFAIVEAPDGTNDLYSIDEEVPGLGRLVAVGPKSATFEGTEGRFEMKLLAAPTATSTAVTGDGESEDLDEAEVDARGDEDFGDELFDSEDEFEPDEG